MGIASIYDFGSHTQHVSSQKHLPTKCVVDRMNATLLSDLTLETHLFGIHHGQMDNGRREFWPQCVCDALPPPGFYTTAWESKRAHLRVPAFNNTLPGPTFSRFGLAPFEPPSLGGQQSEAPPGTIFEGAHPSGPTLRGSAGPPLRRTAPKIRSFFPVARFYSRCLPFLVTTFACIQKERHDGIPQDAVPAWRPTPVGPHFFSVVVAILVVCFCCCVCLFCCLYNCCSFFFCFYYWFCLGRRPSSPLLQRLTFQNVQNNLQWICSPLTSQKNQKQIILFFLVLLQFGALCAVVCATCICLAAPVACADFLVFAVLLGCGAVFVDAACHF